MHPPCWRTGLLLLVYAAWTAIVLSAYYVVPEERISGVEGLQFGGPHLPTAIAEGLRSIAGATAVLLAAWALGVMATARVPTPFSLPFEPALYRLAFGFIALSLLSQVLAAFAIYRPAPVRIILLSLAFIGAVLVLTRVRVPRIGPLLSRDAVFACIALVAMATAFIGALAPEVEYDALWYHLWLPQRWLEAGRPVDIVQEYVSLYPLGWNLSYGAAMTIGGAGAAKLLHFACLPLLALTTFMLCREIAPRASATLAAAIAVTTPTVMWEATTAYVDLALAYYIALSVYALVRHHRTGHAAWLVISALALGGAMTIKHLALVAALILGVLLILSTWRRERRVPIVLRRAAVFTVIALALAAPWYTRAYVASGNPVFPDLYGVFGARPVERWSPSTERELTRFKSRFGRERTAANLAALPWDVSVHGAQYGGSLGPLYLLLIPAGLAAPGPLTKVVAVGAMAYLAVWASPISSYQLRFLLPLLPLLAVLAAAGEALLLRASGSISRAMPPVIVGGTALLLVFNLPFFIEWHDRDRHHGGRPLTHVTRKVPLAVVIGAESRDDYLGRSVSSYRAWQFINGQLPNTARVLTFVGGDHLYSRRERLWSDAAAAYPIAWGAEAGTEAATLTRLHEVGITHVLIDRHQLASGTLDNLAVASTRMRECCLAEVYRDRRVSLYALVSPGDRSRTPVHHCGGTTSATASGNPLC